MNFEKRFSNVLVFLQQNDLDVLLISNPKNSFYLCGFGREGSFLVLSGKNERMYILTNPLYFEEAQKEAMYTEVLEVKNSYIETLKHILCKEKVKKVAFEKEAVTYGFYQKLKEGLKEIELVPTGNIVENLRQFKDQDELFLLQKALEIAEDAFKDVLNLIRPGLKEIEIASALEKGMRDRGANSLSFETIAVSGVRGALPHGTASEKIVQAGEFITLDFGCVYQGYCSDLTRTIGLSPLSTPQKEIYEVVKNALTEAGKGIKKGKKAREVDRLARDLIDKEGYGNNFKHSLGHGVGLEVHEAPNLAPFAEEVLETGMVTTIEPGIYLEDSLGVRIEDMVFIAEQGPIILNSLDRDLIVI